MRMENHHHFSAVSISAPGEFFAIAPEDGG